VRLQLTVHCPRPHRAGQTWTAAKLQKLPQQPDRAWAWSLFEARLPLPPGTQAGQQLELVCKAVDASYNTQPDSVAAIWNLRGVVNNAWHRVRVDVVSDDE
jgi:sulfite oxidase